MEGRLPIAPLPADVGDVAAGAFDALRDVVNRSGDAELVRATACEGWRVADLFVHLRYDAHAMCEAIVVASDAEPDRDYVSYWEDWPAPKEVTFADVRWSWASAAAYATGEGLRRHTENVLAAASAAARRPTPERISFQEHVMRAEDFLAMWAVECALHHLDLCVAIPDAPAPPDPAVAICVSTIDGLFGRGRLAGWDDHTYLKKATGREDLDATELAALGEDAARLPVFG